MTRTIRRLTVGVLALGIAAACAIAWRPGIAPIAPPTRQAFATPSIERGAALAALGDCIVCHTAPNGRPYAGGRAVPTPFGMVHATNISPDPDTGIGHWSLEAFRRAMREGVGGDGTHLYPVLPYPHFAHATDDDIAALYAFVMTRAPVNQRTPANDLTFPANWRPLLAGWNLLYLRSDPFQPDPTKDAAWNRGAYLVEAIGHCGACHSPRNALGAERGGQSLSGGEAEFWYAPALGPGSRAPVAWSAGQLTSYLRTGLDNGHGAAAGPMAAVTEQLASVPGADVEAMAVYIASLMPVAPPKTGTEKAGERLAIFDGACGACHAADAPMTRNGAPSLAFSTSVRAPTARNVVEAILHGLPWREGHAGPYMPSFAAALTDGQVAALANYVRERYSDLPAWADVEATVREARHQGGGT